jgi:sRNA-binding protein
MKEITYRELEKMNLSFKIEKEAKSSFNQQILTKIQFQVRKEWKITKESLKLSVKTYKVNNSKTLRLIIQGNCTIQRLKSIN